MLLFQWYDSIISFSRGMEDAKKHCFSLPVMSVTNAISGIWWKPVRSLDFSFAFDGFSKKSPKVLIFFSRRPNKNPPNDKNTNSHACVSSLIPTCRLVGSVFLGSNLKKGWKSEEMFFRFRNRKENRREIVL